MTRSTQIRQRCSLSMTTPDHEPDAVIGQNGSTTCWTQSHKGQVQDSMRDVNCNLVLLFTIFMSNFLIVGSSFAASNLQDLQTSSSRGDKCCLTLNTPPRQGYQRNTDDMSAMIIRMISDRLETVPLNHYPGVYSVVILISSQSSRQWQQVVGRKEPRTPQPEPLESSPAFSISAATTLNKLQEVPVKENTLTCYPYSQSWPAATKQYHTMSLVNQHGSRVFAHDPSNRAYQGIRTFAYDE